MNDASAQDSLTPKQLAVLECIRDEIAQSGRPPTYRDIAERLGYDAVGTVQKNRTASHEASAWLTSEARRRSHF